MDLRLFQRRTRRPFEPTRRMLRERAGAHGAAVVQTSHDILIVVSRAGVIGKYLADLHAARAGGGCFDAGAARQRGREWEFRRYHVRRFGSIFQPSVIVDGRSDDRRGRELGHDSCQPTGRFVVRRRDFDHGNHDLRIWHRQREHGFFRRRDLERTGFRQSIGKPRKGQGQEHSRSTARASIRVRHTLRRVPWRRPAA